MNRGGTKPLVLEAARLCGAHGIIPEFSFMIGLPTEDRNDVEESLRFAKRLRQVNPAAIITDFKIFTPYPGTRLYDLAVQHGLIPPQSLEEWSAYTWANVARPWIQDLTFVRTVAMVSLFGSYYHEFRAGLKGTARKIGLAVLHYLALIRWKTAFFDYPFEWIVLRRLFFRKI
jgi:hypothetical protein